MYQVNWSNLFHFCFPRLHKATFRAHQQGDCLMREQLLVQSYELNSGQVREEVHQQVEEARRELVAENRTLQKRILELEKGPLASQQQLAAQAESLAQTQAKHAAAEASVAELSSQKHQLEEEHDDLASQKHCLEEEQSLKRSSAERVSTLEEAVREAASLIADGHSKVASDRWGSELERLDTECEELQEQNAQVLLTLQQQQQDLQVALAESRRLSEREAAYEKDLLNVSERNAELGGHANPKQKIKHLMAIKDENQSLRIQIPKDPLALVLLLLLRVTRGARNLSEPQFQELKRCRQRTAQLEGQVRAAQFFETACPQSDRGVVEPRKLGESKPMERTPGRRGDDEKARAPHWTSV
eukprot:g8661.t1